MMTRLLKNLLAVGLGLVPCLSPGLPVIDGSFEDWEGITGVEDAVGDGSVGGVDFLTIKHALSDDELLVYLRTAAPIDWRDSDINLYLDADGNASTGLALGSLGADYVWDFSVIFGRGTYYGLGSSMPLHKGSLIASGAPIGLSDQLEFSIPYSVFANGSGQPTKARLFLKANTTGDLIPQVDGFLQVSIPLHQPPSRIRPDWGKLVDTDVRIISWNVLQDGPYAPDADPAAFGRQLQAINPDIIHFQELYDASTTWVRGFLEEYVPAPEGKFWYVIKQHDCITASLYPIVRFWPTDNNLILEVNLQSVWGRNAIMINAHTPASDNEAGRITETTHMLDWIGAARENGAFAPEMPLFFIGDFNSGTITPEIISMRTGLYPDASGRQVELVPGFGELRDLAPVQLDSPLLYTWRSSPTSTRARFDYIYFPPEQLWAPQSFILAPEMLSSASRERTGIMPLNDYDADHKIVGGDFRLLDGGLPGFPEPRMPEYLRNAWYSLNRLHQPWVRAYGIGWLWTVPDSSAPVDGAFWMYHLQKGWLYSAKEIWPWVWSPVNTSWVLL